jgi:AraC-like DNA-binding protein
MLVDVLDSETGDIIVPAGKKISKDLITKIAKGHGFLTMEENESVTELRTLADEFRKRFVQIENAAVVDEDSDSDFENELIPFIEKLKTRRLIKIQYKKMHHIEEFLSDLAREEEKKNCGYLQMQKLYMKQLLIMIERYCTDNVESSLSSSYKVAENISKYIRENYSDDLSLARLSREFSMTPTYLSRFFKKSTGISLNEYINIVRVTEAEKLLKNPDVTVTQVAFACGFNDSNYFSSVFKKAKGITPKKFSMLNTI